MDNQDLNALDIQQEYYENLPASDGVKYEKKDYNFLLKNVAYALFGAPLAEGDVDSPDLSGYTDRQVRAVNTVYKKILEQKKYSLNNEDVVMSVILVVCCQPKSRGFLSASPDCWVGLEKKRQSEINCWCTAVFRVRKCISVDGGDGARCRVFIDENARAYCSWAGYLQNNTLPECCMVVPRNGEYSGHIDQTGALCVRLTVVGAPSLGARARVLSAADTTSTVTSLGALGVLGVAAFAPVAPALLAGATVATVATGLYGLARSSLHLHDRRRHGQSISVANSEARSCYLHIAGSTVGLAAGASSRLLANVAASGKNMTTTGKVLAKSVNVLRYSNLIANGGGMINNFACLVKKLGRGERPSTLEVFQFASSALFFTSAVMSNKTARSIIEESQQNTIRDYRLTLKNAHRKIFDQATKVARSVKGTIAGNTEIITGIKYIENKQQYFSEIAKSGKKQLCLPIASDGSVKLDAAIINRVAPAVASGTKSTIHMALRQQPSNLVYLNPNEIITIGKTVLRITQSGLEEIAELLEEFSQHVHDKFMLLCSNVLYGIPNELQRNLKLFYPDGDLLMTVAKIIFDFLKRHNSKVVEVLEGYFYEGRIRKEKIVGLYNEIKASYERKQRQYHRRDINCSDCGGYYFA